MAAPSEAAVLAAQVDIQAIALAWAAKVTDRTCLAAHRTSRQAVADNHDDLEAAHHDEAPCARHRVEGYWGRANLLEGGHGNQVSDSAARASPQDVPLQEQEEEEEEEEEEEAAACPCHLERRSLYASYHDCGSYRIFCAGRHPHRDVFCDDGHDRPPVLPPSSRALSFCAFGSGRCW